MYVYIYIYIYWVSETYIQDFILNELQSRTKYLEKQDRKVWYHCLRVLSLPLPNHNLLKGDSALGYVSTQI